MFIHKLTIGFDSAITCGLSKIKQFESFLLHITFSSCLLDTHNYRHKFPLLWTFAILDTKINCDPKGLEGLFPSRYTLSALEFILYLLSFLGCKGDEIQSPCTAQLARRICPEVLYYFFKEILLSLVREGS